MRISGLDRLCWRPSNREASESFYRAWLGLRAEARAEGLELTLGGGPKLLLLDDGPALALRGLRVEFQVEEPDSLREASLQRGLPTAGELRDEGQGWRFFEAVDPDGLVLRFQCPAPKRAPSP
jgi:catechol 2,3-dioxygenase-like lactoylglutathione lyase family enzyme